MDKFVRKIELPLTKKIVENAGLYIVPKSRIKELARIAADAYEDYPLHNWFSGGKYDEYIAEKTMEISLKPIKKVTFRYTNTSALNCQRKNLFRRRPLCITQW